MPRAGARGNARRRRLGLPFSVGDPYPPRPLLDIKKATACARFVTSSFMERLEQEIQARTRTFLTEQLAKLDSAPDPEVRGRATA